jgi:hypothetical protein
MNAINPNLFGARSGYTIGKQVRESIINGSNTFPTSYPVSDVSRQQNRDQYLANVSAYGNTSWRTLTGNGNLNDSNDPKNYQPFSLDLGQASAFMGIEPSKAWVYDLNGDNKISGDENAVFTYVQDKDKDGTVTLQEVDEFAQFANSNDDTVVQQRLVKAAGESGLAPTGNRR